MSRTDDLAAIDLALTRISRIANSRRAAAIRSERAGVALTPTAVAVLATVYRHEPLRISRVAELLELESSRVSKEVAGLVTAGLVSLGADPDDGRASRANVTDRGREAFREYRAAADAILAETLAGWPDEELAALGERLRRLADDLTAYRPEFPA